LFIFYWYFDSFCYFFYVILAVLEKSYSSTKLNSLGIFDSYIFNSICHNVYHIFRLRYLKHILTKNLLNLLSFNLMSQTILFKTDTFFQKYFSKDEIHVILNILYVFSWVLTYHAVVSKVLLTWWNIIRLPGAFFVLTKSTYFLNFSHFTFNRILKIFELNPIKFKSISLLFAEFFSGKVNSDLFSLLARVNSLCSVKVFLNVLFCWEMTKNSFLLYYSFKVAFS
jgi:hypothetical protein